MSNDFDQIFDRNHAGIKASKVMAVVYGGKPTRDALQCLQIGIAVMIDKPFIIFADEKAQVPKNLQRLSVKTIRLDMEGDPAIAAKKIQDLMASDGFDGIILDRREQDNEPT